MDNTPSIWIGGWYTRQQHGGPTAALRDGKNVLLVRQHASRSVPLGTSNQYWHWVGGEVPATLAREKPYFANGKPTEDLARTILQGTLDEWLSHKEDGSSLCIDRCEFMETYIAQKTHLGRPLSVWLYRISFQDGDVPTAMKGSAAMVYYPTANRRLLVEDGIRELWQANAEQHNYFRARSFAIQQDLQPVA